MKKMLWFPLLALALFSCGSGQSSESFASSDDSSSSSAEEIHSITFEITVNRNYWDAEDPDPISFLWGDNFVPLAFKDRIDASSLVVGDAITVFFTGDYRIYETYPSHFRLNPDCFVSLEIKKAAVVKASVKDGAIIAPEGVSLDHMVAGFPEGEVIGEGYDRVPLDGMSSGYLSCSAIEKGEARAFYVFDPRNAKQSPRILWDEGFPW